MSNNLSARVIACLDIDAGRVVKGVNFVDLRDAGDPVELAALYDREGADELVFLDITASSENRDTIVESIEKISEQIFIPFTVAGGIRTVADMRRILSAGADKVGINTSAVTTPDLINEGAAQFGSQCIVVSIDGRQVDAAANTPPRWEVFTHGGRTPTGLDAIEWAKECEHRGAGEILLTSMDRDGTLAGYDIPFLHAVSDAVNIPVVASGGAGSVQHFAEAMLDGKADAVLAASLFHFGTLRISDVKNHLAERGIRVRQATNS